MKLKTPALCAVIIACIVPGTGGCSLFRHHQPKSGWKIVDVNDDSTFITDSPTRAGSITRNVDAGSARQPQASRDRQQQQEHDREQYQQYQQQMQQAPQPQQPQYQPQQQQPQ